MLPDNEVYLVWLTMGESTPRADIIMMSSKGKRRIFISPIREATRSSEPP